jgi:hypothetical protein
MVTVEQILRQARTLSAEERKELVKQLIDTLDASQKRSLRELRGLGKAIWEGVDAQEYVSQLRREWDDRP